MATAHERAGWEYQFRQVAEAISRIVGMRERSLYGEMLKLIMLTHYEADAGDARTYTPPPGFVDPRVRVRTLAELRAGAPMPAPMPPPMGQPAPTTRPLSEQERRSDRIAQMDY